MDNPIRRNLFEIGDNLRKIGENMCQQAKAQEDLDYRKIMMPSLLNFFVALTNLIDELNAWREDELKKKENPEKPIVYPKGYVESDSEFWANCELAEAIGAEYNRNRSDIQNTYYLIQEFIYSDFFADGSYPNLTFTFTEGLLKLKTRLEKLSELFPSPRDIVIGGEQV